MAETNPYQPPKTSELPEPAAKWPLIIPGIALVILGILGCVVVPLSTWNNPPATAVLPIRFAAPTILFFVFLLGNLAGILSGIAMLNRSFYRLAVLGTGFCCIPCFSTLYVFGIPFAVWALIILPRPEVKAAFTR